MLIAEKSMKTLETQIIKLNELNKETEINILD